MYLLATQWILRLHVLPPINTKMNAPLHARSSKFRIYEASRAHNSETFLSSGTQQGFVVQETWCHGFVDTKRSIYTAFPELICLTPSMSQGRSISFVNDRKVKPIQTWLSQWSSGKQTWPEDLDTQTKVWGMEADLRATTQFVASTELRIWCHQF
jgi:hypothetical protein